MARPLAFHNGVYKLTEVKGNYITPWLTLIVHQRLYFYIVCQLSVKAIATDILDIVVIDLATPPDAESWIFALVTLKAWDCNLLFGDNERIIYNNTRDYSPKRKRFKKRFLCFVLRGGRLRMCSENLNNYARNRPQTSSYIFSRNGSHLRKLRKVADHALYGMYNHNSTICRLLMYTSHRKQ